MKWLYRIVSLLHGCRHKWQFFHTIKVFEYDGATKPCETKIILKCTKCGDLKTRKVS